MAYRHTLQSSRYEFKYLIDEPRARAIRQFLRGYVVPDEYMTEAEVHGYAVRSLYLDNASLVLCRATSSGLRNRFKLRIRFYDDDPGSPAFCEIKRRANDVILKKRAAVHRPAVETLLAGHPADPAFLVSPRPSQETALREFCRLRDDLRTLAQVFVVYRREAYMSPDSNALRITFDRELRGGHHTPGDGLRLPGHMASTNVDDVILEIKFTDCCPRWLQELAQAFNLRRCSVPKYVECVHALHMNGFARREFQSGATR